MLENKYIIVAGINGTEKSTLYQLQPKLFSGTKRINADEILRDFGGNWKSAVDNIKAMKKEVQLLHEALQNKISIHVETTLAGTGKSQLRLIDEAHKNGFNVTLLYVTLNSADKAIDRVSQRVEKGGHGIPSDLIKERYMQSNRNLLEVALKSDNVYVYDNSDKFKKVYMREGNKIFKNELVDYPWIDNKIFWSLTL